MSDLNISRKNIHTVFTERGGKFLIPDYQRPYSWGKDECETLWEDLKNFAFPEEDYFDDDNDEYFLGTIVTLYNPEYRQTEVIDGQQRLITLLLLLRAFYEAFSDKTSDGCKEIAKCIWKINPDYTPDKSHFKIKSEVATDDDTAEFNKIIAEGVATRGNKSKYAENYRFFQKKILEMKMDQVEQFSIFPKRILENCIVLPIVTNTFSTALRIFTTLNDRGMPLSDSDIFKSQFYKFFKAQGKEAKENFVKRWRELESICNDNFHPRRCTPMDDLFMKYMYYLIAKSETKSDTFHGLRVYYEKNNYEILKSEKVFEDLITLANFWNDIALRDSERFSPRILKSLYILSFSPYSIWENIVSLYFMGNKDSRGKLDDERFYKFLNKITAMFLMQAVDQPGVQAIRRPFFMEFQNILHDRELNFTEFILDENNFRIKFTSTKFSNTKAITRAILAWWLFQNENQELPPLGTKLEIEHIYAKKRHEMEPLPHESFLEWFGNKALLEKNINIRASDYRFADKKKYYLGKTNKKNEMPTFNLELQNLAVTHEDFDANDIRERNKRISDSFINYLLQNNLLRTVQEEK